ncbi:AAA family ATPase [Spiribacter roseus]|uniref:AAA family ATPase n=1 Tax=Spiribacter roseus TaxID=1855875 RepID=UPI001330E5DF|nr:AAA family ATPase [Spiribacter roseus]KAF0284723.1 hypothetical protein BA898_06180 [Spiribacter roseus]
MTDYRQCWRQDLSDVSPRRLRLARLALNFHRASIDDKARLSLNGAPRALQRLIAPLVDPRVRAKIEGKLEDNHEDELTMLLDQGDEDHKNEWVDLLTGVPDELFEQIRAVDRQDPLNDVAKLLASVLLLDEVERRLLLFVDLLGGSGAFRQLCREGANESVGVNFERLSLLLELPVESVRHALRPAGKLRRLALLKISDHADLEDFLKPGEVAKQAMAHAPRDEDELLAIFLEPLDSAEVELDAFPHLHRQASTLREVLRQAAATDEPGVNALFYGAPGTGKTELAKAVSASLGFAAFSVRTTNAEGEPLGREGRLGGYHMAQMMLQDADARLLIFDEMEDLQSTDELMLAGLTGYAPSQDKGWLNRILESNPVPTIWITNRVRSLDPAARRRFLVPIEFRTPPERVRRQIAERMLKDTDVSSPVIDEIVDDVAITPALLDNARRVARLCPTDDPDTLFRNTLADMRQALHGRSQPSRRSANTTIDLRLLNIEGTNSPELVIEGIRRSGQGRLCLYGKPGTGKTQFAEILAASLERELRIAPASAVLSPYVGETEQNLAELFEGADPEHTVILLDEVDSFLANRSNAQRNWERTQVNELLQQMERFSGVFIAATNLMEGLDPAALRRFDFKLLFEALTREQRQRVFAQEALADVDTPVPETSARLLNEMDGLTLGDIANVRRQQRVLGETLAPEEFLRRLRAEWELKSSEKQS